MLKEKIMSKIMMFRHDIIKQIKLKRKVKRCLKVIKISLSKNNKHFLESCRKLLHFDTMLDKNTINDIKPLNKRYLRCF